MNKNSVPHVQSWRFVIPLLAGSVLLTACITEEQKRLVTDKTDEIWRQASDLWERTDFEELVAQAKAYLGDLYDQSGGLFSDLFGDPADKKETFDKVANRCPEMIEPITKAAARTKISANYLLALAYVESSCNPDAKAQGTTAAGMFQFVEQTWLMSMNMHGGKYGRSDEAQAILVNKNGRAYVTDESRKQEILNLRHDAELSALLAAELAKDNSTYLTGRLDRDLDGTDLYMAHFLGPYGASQFLAALDDQPRASAAQLFPPAAKANPWVFYQGGPDGPARSVREVHGYFKAKIESV